MKKIEYYKNKIMYHLQKIDYAKSKMSGKKHKNILSTVYFVLQNYNEMDFKTLVNVTKLKRKEITQALNQLKELGIADWNGIYLGEKEVIKLEKTPTMKEFLTSLHTNYYKKYGEKLVDYDKYVDEDEPLATESDDADCYVEIKWNDDVIVKIRRSKVKELLENK